MKTLLITGGTNSLAFRIKNKFNSKFSITLGTTEEIPDFLKEQFIKLPNVNSASYTHEFLKAAINNNINYILPLEENEIIKLSENSNLLAEYNIQVLIPNKDELKNIKITNTNDKSLDLTLLINGINVLTDKKTQTNHSGIGVFSEDNKEFILTII